MKPPTCITVMMKFDPTAVPGTAPNFPSHCQPLLASVPPGGVVFAAGSAVPNRLIAHRLEVMHAHNPTTNARILANIFFIGLLLMLCCSFVLPRIERQDLPSKLSKAYLQRSDSSDT